MRAMSFTFVSGLLQVLVYFVSHLAREFPLDNAQKFAVRGGVLHAEVLWVVLADAQLDCLC